MCEALHTLGGTRFANSGLISLIASFSFISCRQWTSVLIFWFFGSNSKYETPLQSHEIVSRFFFFNFVVVYAGSSPLDRFRFMLFVYDPFFITSDDSFKKRSISLRLLRLCCVNLLQFMRNLEISSFLTTPRHFKRNSIVVCDTFNLQSLAQIRLLASI